MPRRRREQHGLQRVLGAPALFATVYGNVGSSIYYALGVTAAFALGLTPLVFLVAGVIFAATTLTYAEGTVRFPEAGGSSSFARHAFNEVVSFGAAWAQMLNYIITIAISAFFVPHYLSIFWEPLKTTPWDIIVGAVVIVLLVLINIVGVREAARLNIGLAVIDFATQLLLVIIGFALIFSPHTLVANIHWGVAPTWSNFLLAIPIGMVAYTGIETVSNLAEEARDPARNVPRAYLMTVIAVFAIYFTLPAIAVTALPVHHVVHPCPGVSGHYQTELACAPPEGFQNDPVLGLVENLGISNATLLHTMKIYVGILAATILFIGTNAGVIGASRITYAMAHYRQLPQVFRRVHQRFRTPWIALIFFAGLIPIVTLIPGKVDFLSTMYSFGAMLSFTIAHLAVITLRARDPDVELVFRGRPNLRVRGIDWPLFALLGAFGTLAAWLVIVDPDAEHAVRRPRLAGRRVPGLLGLPALHPQDPPRRDGPGAGDDPRAFADRRIPDDRGADPADGRVGGGADRGRAPRRRAARHDCGRPRDRGAARARPAGEHAGGRAAREQGAGRRAGARGELRRQRRHAARARPERGAGDRGRGAGAKRGARRHRRVQAVRRPRLCLRAGCRLRAQEQPGAGDGGRGEEGGVRAHAAMTLVFSLLMIGLGIAILVRTALLGGGIGLLLGAIVLLGGVLRLRYR